MKGKSIYLLCARKEDRQADVAFDEPRQSSYFRMTETVDLRVRLC